MSRIPKKRSYASDESGRDSDSAFVVPKKPLNVSNKSNIPSTNKEFHPTNPNVNLKHINKLINMNKNLVSKKPEQVNVIKAPPDEKLDQDIKLQLQHNKKLNEELRQLTDKSDNLEVDMVELKRQQKKTYHRLSEVKSAIISKGRKFDYLEDSIMNNVSNKEKLINIKIQEYAQSLKTEFENFKFELNNEVSIASNFKDEDIESENKALIQKRIDLNQQLALTKRSNNEKLEETKLQIDNQLRDSLSGKISESKKLKHELQSKKSELAEMKLKYEKLNSIITQHQSDNISLQKQIDDIEEQGNNYIDVKTSLLNKVDDLSTSLSNAQSEEAKLNETLHSNTTINDSLHKKLLQHTNSRRVLENAIMNYQKNRIYINVPNTIQFEKNRFNMNNQTYEFSKVTCESSNQELVGEFELFTMSSLTESTTLSYIFCGEHTPNLIEDSVLQSYNNISSQSKSEISFSAKALDISSSSINDLFDGNRQITPKSSDSLNPHTLPCQTMIIDEPKNFETIVQNLDSHPTKVKVLFISFKTHNIDSNLIFIDLSQVPIVQQTKLLGSKETSHIQSILQFIKPFRTIYLAKVSTQTCDILNSLQSV